MLENIPALPDTTIHSENAAGRCILLLRTGLFAARGFGLTHEMTHLTGEGCGCDFTGQVSVLNGHILQHPHNVKAQETILKGPLESNSTASVSVVAVSHCLTLQQWRIMVVWIANE